ncbi:hypothetical protein DRP05_05705 [Archaeoglobales archaeon]|nr:MAG: hypothetical protein DRP05_05705 [Archaeoglobales archaeon]
MRLVDAGMSESEILKKAHKFIRENIGSVPSPKKPILTFKEIESLEGVKKKVMVYEVPIVAYFPTIIYDPYLATPTKPRFKNLGEVGKLILDANTGEVIEKPTVYQVRGAIKSKLEEITNVVDKTLVKTGAEKFSQITLPEHIHTPIIDILSSLLIIGKIDIEMEIEELSSEDKTKYLRIINALEKHELVERDNNFIYPGNVLIELEEKFPQEHDKIITNALAHFFRQGYEEIDSIRIVLGPFLILSRIIYETSLEVDTIVPVPFEIIKDTFEKGYTGKLQKLKLIKLPRYLIQLEKVGLIKYREIHGEPHWEGDKDVFNELKKDTELTDILEKLLAEI